MMRTILFVGVSLLSTSITAQAAPIDWQIDKVHSSVAFTVKHLGLAKVRGEFKEFTGVAKGDDKTGKLDSLAASVAVKSISTENKDRDAHLQSDDFFNAEKFPELKLVLKKVSWKGNEFVADADLTIRDVTKTVSIKGEQASVKTVDFGGGPTLRTGYSATGKISRKDFGLKWNKVVEGISVVSDDVVFELDVELFAEVKAAEPKK